MDDKSDRKELERRLEQAKRAVALLNDPGTTERLQKLVKDLEEQLSEAQRQSGPPRRQIRNDEELR
jgi:predicted GTPase